MTHTLTFLPQSDIYFSPENCNICDQRSVYMLSIGRRKEKMEFKMGLVSVVLIVICPALLDRSKIALYRKDGNQLVICLGINMDKYVSNKYPKTKGCKGVT